MDPEDSKNVYGNSRLQRPNFTLKISYLRLKFGLCSLGFPYKVCIKSPCTSISASSAVLTVHGLLIQTLYIWNPQGPYVNAMYLVSLSHGMPNLLKVKTRRGLCCYDATSRSVRVCKAQLTLQI